MDKTTRKIIDLETENTLLKNKIDFIEKNAITDSTTKQTIEQKLLQNKVV